MTNKLTQKIHGTKIHCPEGYWAYVPSPLPPTLTWNERLLNSLSDADRFLGELSREGKMLPKPHLLIKPFINKEAVLSSRIEGTRTTLNELFADEAGEKTNQNQADLREVKNYVIALEYGMKRLKALPLSLRLIREIHEKLMKDIRGNTATPGEFRRSQNWIGVAGCTLKNATYIPPPAHEMMSCLGELEKFLHASKLPPLITIGLAHSQFEAIHPFLDGNGRVGRLLITLFLIEKNLLPSPLLYLSAFFETNRREYYDSLLAVTEHGEWEIWLEYFLNGVTTLAKESLDKIQKIKKIFTEWKEKLSSKSDENGSKVIDLLLANPFITINEASKKLDIAFTSASRAFEKLMDAHILKQTGKGERNRLFCATKILQILEK